MKKAFKIPKSLKILSIIILSLMFIWAFFFGWGWFVPYALQPSYWEFKKLCKLNELPNNEEKYNKILAYYKISIDDVDWKKVNENKQFLCKKIRKDWRFDYVDDYEFGDCLPNVREYRKVNVVERQINYRLDTGVRFYSNQYHFSKDNITDMKITATWNTRRFELVGNEGSGFYLLEIKLGCTDVIKSTLNTKGK